MNPEEAERLTLENTREVFPGLYVTGMACNATFGGPGWGQFLEVCFSQERGRSLNLKGAFPIRRIIYFLYVVCNIDERALPCYNSL